ncbi:hypothetical protein F2Q68_00015808 [Brassica cretica]|uniref:Uncharacterized protein n=1 Tax=Brassica cretica TaxID=69181 RepID=A0A8S9HT58_BRACR|nr:hypothetical protein F2Q68_00015808 [Brassica cretica]
MPRELLLPNDENGHSISGTSGKLGFSYFPNLNGNRQCEFRFPQESIDSPSTTAQDDWPTHCYPSFALEAATSSQHLDEYDEDYEEERATEYQGTRAEEDRLLHHSSRIRNVTSIDRGYTTSIDTHHHQTNRTQASTDIAYYTSIDNEVDHAQEGKYSIGSWADDHYHESYAVETTIYEPQADEFHEGFTTEELFNHRERSYTNSLFAEACGKGTRFYRPLSRAKRPSIDNNASTSIDNFPKPPSIENEKAKQNNDYLTLDEFGIFSDPEGYRVTKEFYDTAGGVDDRFKPKYRQHTHPSIDRRPEFGKGAYNRDGIRRFHWEQKDEYGVYIDEYEHARGVDGHIIHVSKDDIRNLLEIASMDEHIYICLPEHARSFTQTKLVLEIYTKDEINEILYGISGAQGKNEDDF